MAKDPAFLFYPGDYLRDTQCLSEKSQVAYDRIMCEHMRNICITQQQLNFFIKRLDDEEKKEILFLLKKIDGGYQIEWVAESICKRKSYTKSRAENRKGKTKNISKTYDKHMVIENENENENINDTIFSKIKENFFNDFRWIEKFCRDKNIGPENLKLKMQEFIKDTELREDYKTLPELKSHFTNLFNKQKNGQPITKNNGLGSKSGGFGILADALNKNR